MIMEMNLSRWMANKLAELRAEKTTAISTNADLVYMLRWLSKMNGQHISQIVDRMIREQVEAEFIEFAPIVERAERKAESILDNLDT